MNPGVPAHPAHRPMRTMPVGPAGVQWRRMPDIRFLLEILKDPFATFPMHSVSRELAGLINESDEGRLGRAGPWGVSSKFYSVEDEHDIEVVHLLIGSAFVLGQVTITQTVSVVTKMDELAGKPSWIPRGRRAIMNAGAAKDP